MVIKEEVSLIGEDGPLLFPGGLAENRRGLLGFFIAKLFQVGAVAANGISVQRRFHRVAVFLPLKEKLRSLKRPTHILGIVAYKAGATHDRVDG